MSTDLAATIGAAIGAPVVVVDVQRSTYSTSAPIDELRVRRVGGSVTTIVRKDLAWSSLLPAARATKPRFLHAPAREIGVYRHVLPDAPPGPAAYLGVVEGPGDRRWLLLERLRGHELFQVGELEHWQEVARWIATFHRRFAGQSPDPVDVPLLVHDAVWFRGWAERALVAAVPADRRRVERAASLLANTAPRLAALTHTVVHGELYASNVLVDRRCRPTRVSVVDWEMAAWSCPLLDLAALTAGPWLPARRRAIEEAYAEAAGRPLDGLFAAELDLCRLALCLQWLGWRAGWRPPPDHSQDWLAAADVLVERIPA